MSFDPPPLPPMQPTWGQFQVWWQQVINGLQAVLGPLLDLNNDDILTPGKKPLWVFENSYLTSEQAGLDAQATTLGITTEKTAYDAAVTAMTAYLATLTSPVAWNDFSGNTDVIGVTLRTKFNDVLVAKQALINAMQIASSGDAAAALAAASAAQTTADAAQATADTVRRDDSIADSIIIPGDVLSATDAGSNASIAIATHNRQYNDGTTVSVTGSTLTGLSYSTQYFIYYDDPSRSGGGVTFHSTTDAKVASPGAAVGRHYVAFVTTPAAAGAPVTGGHTPPYGGGDIRPNYIA